MKILMLSTDPRVFEKGSAVGARLAAYGALTDGLHVLVTARPLRERKVVRLSPEVTLEAVPVNTPLARPLALARVGARMRNERFSLVTAQDPFETGFAGLLLSRLLRVPLEVQAHTDFLSPFFVRGSLINRVRVLLASIVLPRARAIRVVSERIKRSILERYRIPAERIIVLPVMNPAVSPYGESPRLKERFPEATSISLAASRFEPEKNIPALLDAFAEVLRTETGVILILLGEGMERPALERHARSLGIEKSLVFEGWQSVGPYLGEADLFVQNSLYEGYGLTLVEAAQAGCPILTTDVGIVGEVLTEENVSVVPPGDTRALARAWQTALENPQFMREKAEGAREAVARHAPLSPEAYAEAIVGLWREACAQPV